MKLRIFDLIFPSICELCRTQLENGRTLCNPCIDRLPRIRAPFCQRCGEIFDGFLPEDFQCPNCQNLKLDFEFARASLRGLETAFELVHALKYQRKFFVAKDLARILSETWKEDDRFRKTEAHCLVMPVPLYWRRQQWRQGNQAFELAREFCKLTSLPLSGALKRIRPTGTQTKLNRQQRLSNLKGAFRIQRTQIPRLEGAHVILIDDVFTTGATAQACTGVLKSVGKVSSVAVLTLVRG